MAISKKLRFEVFKRDGFRCAYCGKSPPEVVLEVDHIQPKSKGGKNHINNYLTACFSCNRGKSNVPLDKAPQQLVDNLEVLRQKEDQLKEYQKYAKRLRKLVEKDVDQVQLAFQEFWPKYSLAESFRVSVRKFLSKLTANQLCDMMTLACTYMRQKHVNSHESLIMDASLRYFCGCCWREIREKEGNNGVAN